MAPGKQPAIVAKLTKKLATYTSYARVAIAVGGDVIKTPLILYQ